MAERFANDTATGTLAAYLSVSGTALTLATGGAKFPAVALGERLRIRVDDELMAITEHAANANTMTVERGLESTTAVAHSIGTAVNAVLTADSLISALTEIHGGSAPFIGPDQPDVEGGFVWLETDNPVGGWTLWLDDGS